MFSWRENIAKIQLKFKMPNKKLIFIFLIYASICVINGRQKI